MNFNKMKYTMTVDTIFKKWDFKTTKKYMWDMRCKVDLYPKKPTKNEVLRCMDEMNKPIIKQILDEIR